MEKNRKKFRTFLWKKFEEKLDKLEKFHCKKISRKIFGNKFEKI